MKGQDIVMFCQQNWNVRLGTNARNLAREFAKHNRVLYVNVPLDVSTLLGGFRRPEVRQHLRIVLGLAAEVASVEPGVWVCTPACLALSINWLPAGLFTPLNRLNAWLLARRLRKAASTLGFQAPYLLQDGLLYQGTELKRLLRPQQFIYYLRDYMIPVPYFRRHGPRVEAQLLAQADVVAANSAYLGDYARQHNPHSHDIGQGCVLAAYQASIRHAMPPDLAAVPEPRIGYTGFLTTVRLDLDLLLTIARQRPEWNLVLVGPENPVFADSALHQLPNVYFLGNKTPAQLPAYVQHFNVCINPQLLNPVTEGNYPLKIDEYLAMGKPVVATYTRTMDLFKDHVYLAGNSDDWLEMLEVALTEVNPGRAARGIAFAQSHTWAASAGKLYAALHPPLPAAPPGSPTKEQGLTTLVSSTYTDC